MKLPLALLASAALILGFSSCDSHPWTETQVLHEGMHKSHGADGHQGEGHAQSPDHAKPEHTQKPGEHTPPNQEHGATKRVDH